MTMSVERPRGWPSTPASGRRRARRRATSGTGCGPAKVTRQPGCAERESQAEERAEDVTVRVDVAQEAEHAAGRLASRSRASCGGRRDRRTPALTSSSPAAASVGPEPGQQRLDMRRVLHGAVGTEGQLGRHAQVEVLPQPVPDEAAGALERLERLAPTAPRARGRRRRPRASLRSAVVSTSVTVDEAQPRVLELRAGRAAEISSLISWLTRSSRFACIDRFPSEHFHVDVR